MITITQSDLETLLCRPLTSCEASNFTLYLENVKTQLTQALCYDPFVGGVATRDFEYNHDGKIYLLPPFTNLVSVSISDCDDDNLQDIVCDWTPVNKNKQTILNGSCAFGLLRCICNTCESISCCNNKCKILKVEADWASCPMDDLKLVALKMLEQEVKSDDCNKDVKSKTIRSMTVTYKDYEQRDFLSIYKPIIDKWSICHDDVG